MSELGVFMVRIFTHLDWIGRLTPQISVFSRNAGKYERKKSRVPTLRRVKRNYSRHRSIIWPVWPNGWVFVYELSGCGFESSCSHLNLDFAPASSKDFLDIQGTIECRFTLKRVLDMIRTYSQNSRHLENETFVLQSKKKIHHILRAILWHRTARR